MLLEKMYVRCPIDHDMVNPRDFLTGQIAKIDTFADTAFIMMNFRNLHFCPFQWFSGVSFLLDR